MGGIQWIEIGPLLQRRNLEQNQTLLWMVFCFVVVPPERGEVAAECVGRGDLGQLRELIHLWGRVYMEEVDRWSHRPFEGIESVSERRA